MSIFGLPLVTIGLNPDVSGSQTSLMTGGLSSILVPQPNLNELSPSGLAGQNAAIAAALNAQVGSITPVGIQSNGTLGIPLGGVNTPFSLNEIVQNPTSITGQQVYNPYGAVTSDLTDTVATYTGSDLHIVVDMVNAPTVTGNKPPFKQLIECTTFSISIHREKAAVRAAGYINPKAFARGRRTIAGTMVLTQFTIDVLYTFLMSQQILGHDVSKDTQYVKVDQLPPFNMTMFFTDEYGNSSYRRILGVDFVTDGIVYSSNDMISEQTISYMASDFTPLLNVGASPIFGQNYQTLSAEQTVQSILQSNPQQAGQSSVQPLLPGMIPGTDLPD